MDEPGPSEQRQHASANQPTSRPPSNRNHNRLSLAPLTSLDAGSTASACSSSRTHAPPQQGKSAPNTPGHHHHHHHRNTSTSSRRTPLGGGAISAPVSRAASSAHLPGSSSSSSSLYNSHGARRHRPRPRYEPPQPTFLDKCHAIGHALQGFVREERGQTSHWTRRDDEDLRPRRSSSFLTPFGELYGDGVGNDEVEYREYARVKSEEMARKEGLYSPGFNGHGGGSRLNSRRGSAAFLGGMGGGSVPLTPRTPRDDYFDNGAAQSRTPRRRSGAEGMGHATVPEEADFVDLELLREQEEEAERDADAQANMRRYMSERRSGTWPWFFSWFGLPLYEPLDVEQEEEYKAWDLEGELEAAELKREAAERCRERRTRVHEDKDVVFDPPREQGSIVRDYAWLSTLAVSLLRG